MKKESRNRGKKIALWVLIPLVVVISLLHTGISSAQVFPMPVKIVTSTYVYSGPGTSYSTITTVNLNQKFVAIEKSGDGNWYRIYLPYPPPQYSGYSSGWIWRSYTVEDPSATQIEVKNTGTLGLNIRTGPGISYSELTPNIWDGQRFVKSGESSAGDGCDQKWYKFYLPANAGAPEGSNFW